MPSDLSQYNRQAKIKTPLGGPDAVVLTRFTAVESISEPFTIVADVIVNEGAKTIYEHLGAAISIEVIAGPARSRHFHGRLWDITELQSDIAGDHYRLTLKPWASFLDLNIENRIYQEKMADDIVKDITGRRSGIGPKLQFQLSGALPVLEYSVQWQESDYNYIARMFERHGIYYYYRHTASDHEMIATDEKSSHARVSGIDTPIEVLPESMGAGRPGGAIWNFSRRFEVAPYMATVTDYDFLTPTQALKADKKATAKSTLDRATVAELYVHPGGFTKATGANRGPQISERLLEAARVQSERCSAEGDAFAVAVGATIDIKAGPNAPTTRYLITQTTHIFTGSAYRSGGNGQDEMTVRMELIPATVQYRPLLKTPRPRIYGPQTAVVAGADGEEIDTDKHGRIKVHFHWDRVQDGGATSSCWIRVAQSMAGPAWGGFVLPRIGQEVVVEFLNGDPDAPLVTGAVYNGANAPPYALPANKTRTTFKSRSSPNSQGFNELRFEDKAGSEEVYFHAEKDLNSVIDKGNETRTLNSGNRTTKISKGDETLEIVEGKRTQTIEGDETLTIKKGSRKEEISKGDETLDIVQGKRTQTIKGNDTLTIKTGNRDTSIDMGNDTLTIKMGNQTIKLAMGKHATEAMQSIELKCGGSTFKMTPMSIEMKSMMIKIEGSLMFETKSLMSKQEATAMHIVKGGIVMIN